MTDFILVHEIQHAQQDFIHSQPQQSKHLTVATWDSITTNSQQKKTQ